MMLYCVESEEKPNDSKYKDMVSSFTNLETDIDR